MSFKRRTGFGGILFLQKIIKRIASSVALQSPLYGRHSSRRIGGIDFGWCRRMACLARAHGDVGGTAGGAGREDFAFGESFGDAGGRSGMGGADGVEAGGAERAVYPERGVARFSAGRGGEDGLVGDEVGGNLTELLNLRN